MAEDLQGLLERINEEGLKKIESEREQLLSEARAEAEKIRQEAQADRDRLIEEARGESAKMVHAGEEKLRQACRDVIISLESDLKERLSLLVKGCVRETSKPDFLAKLILTIAGEYATRQGRASKVEVLVPQDQLTELEASFKAALGDQFKDGVTVRPVSGMDAGVQVSYDGESVYHDFSDEAITDMLCAYLNPQLVALMRGSED